MLDHMLAYVGTKPPYGYCPSQIRDVAHIQFQLSQARIVWGKVTSTTFYGYGHHSNDTRFL